MKMKKEILKKVEDIELELKEIKLILNEMSSKNSMNFEMNELTQQVAHTARDFANQHIKPHVMEWDESQEFPLYIFKELGKLGMMGVLVPGEYGGAGLSYFEYNVIIQEIAKVCGS